MTFDEINSGIGTLTAASAAEFRKKNQPTREEVLRAFLAECRGADFQRGMRGTIAKQALRCRVAARLKRDHGYGNPLLLLILSAAIYELICLAVEWLWHRFVKERTSTGQFLDAHVNELHELAVSA